MLVLTKWKESVTVCGFLERKECLTMSTTRLCRFSQKKEKLFSYFAVPRYLETFNQITFIIACTAFVSTVYGIKIVLDAVRVFLIAWIKYDCFQTRCCSDLLFWKNKIEHKSTHNGLINVKGDCSSLLSRESPLTACHFAHCLPTASSEGGKGDAVATSRAFFECALSICYNRGQSPVNTVTFERNRKQLQS